MSTERMELRESLLLEDGQRLGDVMDDWQREDFLALDDPAHRHAYLERPRGHSKTGDVGSEACVELLTAHEAALYCIASDEDQARILFDDVAGKLRRGGYTEAAVRVLKDRIVCTATGSVLKVLTADVASSWGLRPDWIACDETVAWRYSELWESLWTATGKRPNCRVLVISTAGWDKDHFAWTVREMARSEANWYFSSRGQCATWVDPEWLAQQERTLPAHVYARLHLNLWIEGVGAFLTEAEVDAIFTEAELPATIKHMAGLDLGVTKDRSVLALVGSADEGRVVVRKLATWVPPKGGKVDLQAVEDEVESLMRTHAVAACIYDPHQAQHMAQRLRVRSVPMLEYTFTSASRRDLFAKLLDLIRRRKLVAAPHAELRRELLHLEVTETAGGWRADHKRGRHDDHVVAVALAAQRIVTWAANRDLREQSSTSTIEAEAATRVARQVEEAAAKVVERWGDSPEVHEKIAAIKAAFPTEPDMVRRHLVAYSEAESMKERLQRAYGLKGRGEFSDRMESDEEWDNRPE
jgi:hypothetical protein